MDIFNFVSENYKAQIKEAYNYVSAVWNESHNVSDMFDIIEHNQERLKRHFDKKFNTCEFSPLSVTYYLAIISFAQAYIGN